MALFKKNTLPAPKHIAVIMDGNGRWAKKRGLPRSAGHKAGAEAFRRITEHCYTLGVEYLTVYAFSTENWKRSEEEVAGIISLLENYLDEALRDLDKNGVHLKFFGDLSRLSPALQEKCRAVEEKTAVYNRLQLNFCFNYGGRDEIIRAARAIADGVAKQKLALEDITEDTFSRYLYSAQIPDPELIIRPSGEMRISNFLLWQCAYSEFVFMDVLWPDFSNEDLDRAISEYHGRNRRFGGA